MSDTRTIVLSTIGTGIAMTTVIVGFIAMLSGGINTRIDELTATVNSRIDDLTGTVNSRVGDVKTRIGTLETDVGELRNLVSDAIQAGDTAEN